MRPCGFSCMSVGPTARDRTKDWLARSIGCFFPTFAMPTKRYQCVRSPFGVDCLSKKNRNVRTSFVSIVRGFLVV